MKLASLAACTVLMVAAPARAQEIVWDVINEYPATSLAGEADAVFAEAVQRVTAGRLVIRPIPDAKSGLRSREQLTAVSEGRFAMANSVGGTLGDESAVFLLSSLPFVARSAADARALSDAARSLYEQLFAARRQKLLYVSPWPPSGIWSASAVASRDALGALKIRTYDKTGTDVFAQVAALASVISFADLGAKLASGEINAVLSSGDGGAGRRLWTHLQYFSDITYAVPLSFASVSLAAWTALEEATRAGVEQAARETTDRQWEALAGRVAKNFATMRENGVAIDEQPPAEVMEALRAAAANSIAEWRNRAGPEAIKLLDDHRGRAMR